MIIFMYFVFIDLTELCTHDGTKVQISLPDIRGLVTVASLRGAKLKLI